MIDNPDTHKHLSWPLVALSALRISIGWHFLYEGLLKVADPNWSAADYLSNSTGPFAAIFQGIALNPTLLGISDFLNQWGLVLVGLSLMLGLLSRWACLGGILLLSFYYLANPPFIGLADLSFSEGNYLIINKNLIELITLWVLYFSQSSKVYGMDRFFRRSEPGN